MKAQEVNAHYDDYIFRAKDVYTKARTIVDTAIQWIQGIRQELFWVLDDNIDVPLAELFFLQAQCYHGLELYCDSYDDLNRTIDWATDLAPGMYTILHQEILEKRGLWKIASEFSDYHVPILLSKIFQSRTYQQQVFATKRLRRNGKLALVNRFRDRNDDRTVSWSTIGVGLGITPAGCYYGLRPLGDIFETEPIGDTSLRDLHTTHRSIDFDDLLKGDNVTSL